MQEILTPKPGEGASLSRRNFIAIAAAGTAATLPAVALAGAIGKTSRLPQSSESLPDESELPLDAQFDACIANLRSLLAQMYPIATDIHSGFWCGRLDGSFRFIVQGDPQFGSYNGPGLYEISVDGYPMTYWLEERSRRSTKTGEPMKGFEYYQATLWMDGALSIDNQRQFCEPKIMRKLDWVRA